MKFYYRHNVSVNPVWVPDDAESSCYCCHGLFTMLIRRHHCRLCGHLVCDACSKYKQRIQGNLVRTCRSCSTYLSLRRSNEDIGRCMKLINHCVSQYRSKWRNMEILLRAQSECIRQIQINQRKGHFVDDSVRVSIQNYVVPSLVASDGNERNLDIDVCSVGLSQIEALLDRERSDDMVYFIAMPPKHNPKLSPWTRRLLLITADGKILVTSPLDTEHSVYQFVDPQPVNEDTKSDWNTDTISKPPFHGGTCIHFQYYAPLNRLYQQQILPISPSFSHIPQFTNLRQQTCSLWMRKRNEPLTLSADSGSKSASPRSPTRKRNSKISKDIAIAVKKWSYFTQNAEADNPKLGLRISNDFVSSGQSNEDLLDYVPSDSVTGGALIDVDRTPPTLCVLAFCVQFHPSSQLEAVSRSGSQSAIRRNSLPPAHPPPPKPIDPTESSAVCTPRLGDVLPAPQQPPSFLMVTSTSPAPPLPPPITCNAARSRSNSANSRPDSPGTANAPRSPGGDEEEKTIGHVSVVDEHALMATSPRNGAMNIIAERSDEDEIDEDGLDDEEEIDGQLDLELDALIGDLDKEIEAENEMESKKDSDDLRRQDTIRENPVLDEHDDGDGNAEDSLRETERSGFQSVMSRLFKRTQSQSQSAKERDVVNNEAVFKQKKVVPAFDEKNSAEEPEQIVPSLYDKFTSFISGDGNVEDKDRMNQDSSIPSLKRKSFGSLVLPFNESEVAANQSAMFTDSDWASIDFVDSGSLTQSDQKMDCAPDDDGNLDSLTVNDLDAHSAFHFDSAQDLHDVIQGHRHRYLKSFYRHVVCFHRITGKMDTAVSWDAHSSKLRVLWNNMVAHTERYKKEPLAFDAMVKVQGGAHAYWKEIGFQGLDPQSDFRGMGEFALDCLVYFSKSEWAALIFGKSREADNYYPLCASFINLVNLICELTNARKVDKMDILQQSDLLKLFVYEDIGDGLGDEYRPFMDMFCLLCRVFDNVWRATKSFYWDFPKLYQAFKERIEFMLSKEPKSLGVLQEWLETDTYLFEYKETSDLNGMDEYDSILVFLNDK